LNDILASMGIRPSNIDLLVSASWLKFGLFKTALGTRPIALLRMAYLTICGKRNFTSAQNPPVCAAV
jgi:hypothetical protein